MDRLRVLVADDEETIRDLIRLILQDKGCDVTVVDGGRAAVDRVREQIFDLVFLDFMMPEVNGLEACRELQRMSPATPIVMISGFARQVEQLKKEEALELGALKLIPKPFTVEDIQHTVDEIAARSPCRDG